MRSLLLTSLILGSNVFKPAPGEDGLKHSVEKIPTPAKTLETLPRQIEARRAWKLIEENRSVPGAGGYYADALPKGVMSSNGVVGFSGFQNQSYRRFAKNLYGLTVYDISYTLLHRYGGTYLGRGHYLDSVTILPHRLEVAWGYKVSLCVRGLSVTNAGTRDSPVASLLMELAFRVATIIKTLEFRANYEFRGDSAEVRTYPAEN